MREGLDFSSLLGLLTTLLGIVLVSVVAVSIRMLFMQTIQRKRERENRQINERLRTLIAAYKTLGGSFTGELSVDPTHLRDLLQAAPATPADGQAQGNGEISLDTIINTSSERKRRVRDVVEAALADILLLGTEEQVRLAAHAANEMVAGHKVHLTELVVSLRTFIRQALDLEPIPSALHIPHQGPVRPSSPGGTRGGGRAEGKEKGADGGKGGRAGGGAAGMGAGAGGGMARAHGRGGFADQTGLEDGAVDPANK